MALDDFIDKLHTYREKRAEEIKGMSLHDETDALNERGLQIARDLGLRVASPDYRKLPDETKVS